MNNSNTTLRGQARTGVTNKVLKNTYILLSMTLLTLSIGYPQVTVVWSVWMT